MKIKDLTNFEEIKPSEASKVIGGKLCFPPPPPPPPLMPPEFPECPKPPKS